MSVVETTSIARGDDARGDGDARARFARVRGVVEVRGDGELAAREGDALRPSTREEVGGDGRRGVARATEEVAEARELFGVNRAKGALLRGDDVAETVVLG